MSIRLRLTLLYTGIVALTLLAFTTAVYAITSSVTLSAAEQTLIAQAQQLAERPHFDGGSPPGGPGASPVDIPPEHGFAAAPIVVRAVKP